MSFYNSKKNNKDYESTPDKRDPEYDSNNNYEYNGSPNERESNEEPNNIDSGENQIISSNEKNNKENNENDIEENQNYEGSEENKENNVEYDIHHNNDNEEENEQEYNEQEEPENESFSEKKDNKNKFDNKRAAGFEKQEKIEEKNDSYGPEMNFHKLKNSKLFQKFLKEEIQQANPQLQKDQNRYIPKNNNISNNRNYNINNNRVNTNPSPNNQRIYNQKPMTNNYVSRGSNPEDDKELAGYSQIVPGNYQPNPYIAMPYINQMDPNIMGYNSNMYDYGNQNLNDEQVYGKNKIADLTDLLTKEMENNQTLEKRCIEYMHHIDRLTKNYEEIKNKLIENNASSNKRRENKQDNLEFELNNLKRNLEQEAHEKNILERENQELNSYVEQLQSTLKEKEVNHDRKSEDVYSLKRAIESLKNENFSFKVSKEKLEEKIKDQEISLLNSNNELDFERKKNFEMKDRLKFYENETEKIKAELSSFKGNYNNLLLDNESLKNEVYNLKQLISEKNQKEMQFTILIEKANMETNQFKVLLTRAEKNLADQKDQNQSLIKKLSDIAKEKFQMPNLRSTPDRNQPNLRSTPERNPINQDFYYNDSKLRLQQQQPYEENKYRDEINNENKRNSINNYQNAELLKPISQNQNRIQRNEPENYNNIYRNIPNKNYKNETSSNFLEWQEPNQFRNNPKLKNDEIKRNFVEKPTERPIPMSQEQSYKKQENIRPQSRAPKENIVKNNEVEYQNTLHTIKTVEKNLMLAQIQKEKMENELRKVEEARIKTAANIRRKTEIEDEIKILGSNIAHLKNKLREMNALHSY